ncbi:MAG: ATP-binding cassette domain-containing protein [Chloroflexi bacterium]|nr:ATP-binding cassette domain-containing protein [Chloroflexota bacterium]
MILGTSGSGKTTLLKLCKGLLVPQRGDVRVLGDEVAAPRRGRLDPRVAYIPQQLGLVRSLSAMENALVGALARVGTLPSLLRLMPEPEVRRARELLGRPARRRVHLGPGPAHGRRDHVSRARRGRRGRRRGHDHARDGRGPRARRSRRRAPRR